MIKKTHALIIVILLCKASFSQISEKAAGINLFAGTLIGIEANYQDKITEKGMMDYKFGYGKMNRVVHIRASANYDIIFPFEKNFNFYAGPGLTTGYYYLIGTEEGEAYNGAILNITANLGAEYYFDFPLKIAFVIRPEVNLVGRGGEATGSLLFSYYF